MHIAIVHGYFLNGTGSNLYVQNLCKELVDKGHRVSLFSQEEDFSNFEFVDRLCKFNVNNREYEEFYNKSFKSNGGRCTLVKPNLEGRLPVFVMDDYKGYDVYEVHNMNISKIEKYIDLNVRAMHHMLEKDVPDLVISNHLALQPIYTEKVREKVPFKKHVVVYHGSCFNFSVKHSEYLKAEVKNYINNIDNIIFSSTHSKELVLNYFDWNDSEKFKIIPMGTDVSLFKPKYEVHTGDVLKLSEDASNFNTKLERRELKDVDNLNEIVKSNDLNKIIDCIKEGSKNKFMNVDENIKEKLLNVDFKENFVISYFGKLIWTKGVQNLILMMPILMREVKNSTLLITGFGTLRTYLESLISALDSGNGELVYSLIKDAQKLSDHVSQESLDISLSFLNSLKESGDYENYISSAKDSISKSIIFTGYLDHDLISKLLPLCSVFVMPSVHSESFGMAAVEAMSSGVIPLQANHSGMKDVISNTDEIFKDFEFLRELHPLNLNSSFIPNILNNLNLVNDFFEEASLKDVKELKSKLYDFCLKHYDWKAIAEEYANL